MACPLWGMSSGKPAIINPTDLTLTDLVNDHTEHLSDWESRFCGDVLRRCSFGGETSLKQGEVIRRIQAKVAKILNTESGAIVRHRPHNDRPTLSESDQDALDALQDALDNDRVPDKSKDFATDLIRKGKKYGLSEKQMYWVRKLGGVTAATVASVPTNPEIEALRPYLPYLNEKNAKFAGDLVKQYDLRGSLSSNQWTWVEKMTITGKEAHRTALREDNAVIPDYTAVVELFDRTEGTLKQPKIHLLVDEGNGVPHRPGWTPMMRELVVRAKRRNIEDPDTLYVEIANRTVQMVEKGDGTNRRGRSESSRPESMGQVEKTPKIFRPRNHTPDDVLIVMEQFRNDPLGTIVRLGKATGRCSFCGSPLWDRRSRAHGYGPVCAKHYGLEWSHDHADEVEAGIEEAVGRQVMELRPGVWSVVDVELNEVIISYDNIEQAQADLDEWSRLERTYTDGGEA